MQTPDGAPELVTLSPDDWREFRAVRLASLADAPDAFGSLLEDWADAEEARWRDRLTAVPFTVVARREGRPVGVVSGSPQAADTVELISMWVAPDERGTGLAARLVDAVVAWAAARGCDTFLMVRADNHRARRAYERAGFVDRGVPDGWPADAAVEHRMWRSPGA